MYLMVILARAVARVIGVVAKLPYYTPEPSKSDCALWLVPLVRTHGTITTSLQPLAAITLGHRF